MIRYATWAAVSRKEQAEPDRISLQHQIERADELAASRGWRCTAGPYVVRGESRSIYLNLSDAEQDIPELREMLDAAQRGAFDLLIAYDTNRFRNLAMQVFNALSDYNIQVLFVSQPVEPAPPEQYDPAQSDTMRIIINTGQLTSDSELFQIRRRYRAGMRGRILRDGLPIQIPWGYRRPQAQTFANVREFRKAIPEPDPLLTPHIIHIKDLFLSGYSIRQLVDYLVTQHIPPPRRDRWHPGTVRDILRNPFYAGWVRFEVSKVVKDRRANRVKRNRKIPADKIQIARGRHTPLWDDATHQAILMELKRRSISYKGRQNNQFTGLVMCSECKSSAWRYANGSRSVDGRLIWRCSVTSKHIAIHHGELIEKVANALETTLRPTLEKMQARPQLREKAEDTAAQIAELKAQRTRMENAFKRNLLSFEAFEGHVLEIDEQIQAVQAKASTAQYHAAQRAIWIATLMADVDTITANIHTWLKNRDPVLVNQMLHNLLDTIEVIPVKDDYMVKLNYKE